MDLQLLAERVGAGFESATREVVALVDGAFALVGDVDPEVDAFLDAHPVPQGALVVAQHRERRLVNQRLRNRLLGT